MEKYCYDIPRLTPEEDALPISKYYYDYPLHKPNPLISQILAAGPMDPGDAQPVTDPFRHMRVAGYDKVEYGYCMMPDGTGYMATYSTLPEQVTAKMRMWYVRWMNIKSKNHPDGVGNVRYKLWNQVDHIDHGLVDGDMKKGIYTLETLDMGRGSEAIQSVRHNFDIRDYGFPEEEYQKLLDAGIGITACWESFDCPGSHLILSVTRPCPLGGVENIVREWIGWKAENGKFVRDYDTPDFMLNEQYLYDVMVHNTVEQQHMGTFLPALYKEYSVKERDAD